MRYKIFGTTLPAITLSLMPGEQVFTQSGGMAWMTDNFAMDTNMEGGLLGGLKRAVSGESIFIATYTCERAPGDITFSSSFPGSIVPRVLDGSREWICQKSSFRVAERSVVLDMQFRKRIGVGLFGGEGFILQKLSGYGTAFMEIDGEAVEKYLQPGETLLVDAGHVALFEASVSYDIQAVPGLKNAIFGGEGIFFARLSGPGKVYLQTMPVRSLAERLLPFLPRIQG